MWRCCHLYASAACRLCPVFCSSLALASSAPSLSLIWVCRTHQWLSSSEVPAKICTVLPLHLGLVAKQVKLAFFRLVGCRSRSEPWLLLPTRI